MTNVQKIQRLQKIKQSAERLAIRTGQFIDVLNSKEDPVREKLHSSAQINACNDRFVEAIGDAFDSVTDMLPASVQASIEQLPIINSLTNAATNMATA